MQTNLQLISDVESLVLGSRMLSFEDKKKMLYKLPQMTEGQLTRLRDAFVVEIEDWKHIENLQTMAWNGLATSLNAIAA